MEVEKDFIKREIQKLTILLNRLIEKINGLNSNTVQSGIEEINKSLESEFDLTLRKIIQMENAKFLKHLSELHESHTEKLAELMYSIVINNNLFNITRCAF